MHHEWRLVPGLLGVRVGSDGQLQTTWTTVGLSSDRWRKLATHPHEGYLRFWVPLGANQKGGGSYRRMFLHQAVCLAFHGQPLRGQEVCHNDGNKLNNSAANLRWGTKAENNNDMIRHGTTTRLHGENNPAVKLTADLVQIIRRRIRSGETQVRIAKDFNIARATVGAIATRRIWRHLPESIE